MSRSTVTARGAVLVDTSNGKVLYSKDAHKRILPASTTKVMTALLVLEKLSLDSYVTVSERATGMQPSKLNLRAGEQYRVRDLLYGILLNSANDASVVLAEAVAGSEWDFVQMMNQRARQLGARNTKFANSSGLPSKTVQYSTAYDMYLIFRQALKNGFFKQAITMRYKSIYSRDGRKFNLKSHNKMLFKSWKRTIYGKTGYTRAARSCFVGHVTKGNRSLIVAVFGCTKRWDDIYRIVERYGGVDL
ncbi:MAG: D-alanyl-D-alanine carboxypeptidase [Candidatus Omnitrophica bacterium]|nr:D-alanyl-D-alanine carboxypeptidase [Candidatus Omnitrophota bacterium]